MGIGSYLFVGVIIVAIVLWIIFSRRKGYVHPTVKLVKEEISKIDPKIADIPIYVSDSAYTENKTTVYICLRHPRTGEAYNMNTLIYVTLHEIAHVLTEDYDDHGPKWQNNFSNLLNKAYKLGIYDPSQPIPKDYCGIHSYGK